MIDKNKLPKAYKEVYEILKYIPEEDYKKIPKSMIKVIKKGMDKSYDFKVTEFEDFQKQEMLSETECILAIFYRDYWATEFERKIIIENEEKDRNSQYKIDFLNNNNDDLEYDDNNKSISKTDIDVEKNSITVLNEGLFGKLIKRIKHWLNLK